MSFADVGADAYDLFMGRFSAPLAWDFVDWVGLTDHARALDVGCGTGALTRVLVDRLGADDVVAVDPSAGFVAAVRDRLPGVDARRGEAEALPFADHEFDATLAELVVHFMTDAAAGVAEMVRVTRPGGVVAACVWDFENDRAPHAAFLRATWEVTGAARGTTRPGGSRGDLARLLSDAGCGDVEETELIVAADYATFDEWWDAHTRGIGTWADRLDGLGDEGVAEVRRRALALVGPGPFTISATAWAARGTAPGR